MGLKNVAAELAVELMSTPEYAGLRAAKTAVSLNRNLKGEMEELGKKQALLFSGRLSKRESESLAAEIERELKRLSGIPEFGSYMNASARFNKILGDTFRQIKETIETDLR